MLFKLISFLLARQIIDIVPSFLLRYVDVILQLIDKAGDFVSDDIWFRVVQFVTNNEDLQVILQSVVIILLLSSWHIIHQTSLCLISPMQLQKLVSILTNQPYMRQWLRYVGDGLYVWDISTKKSVFIHWQWFLNCSMRSPCLYQSMYTWMISWGNYNMRKINFCLASSWLRRRQLAFGIGSTDRGTVIIFIG